MSEPDESRSLEPVSLGAPAYFQDRPAFLGRLRETCPVAEVEAPGYGRAWVVTRHADVRAVLTDARLAKDDRRWPGGGRHRPSEDTGVGAHLLHVDPPEHTRLRRVVRTAMRPRVATLRPQIERITRELLDDLDETRAATGTAAPTVDLVERFARPLPIAVLSELLGIPAGDRAWLAATVAAYDEPAQHAPVERALAAYLGDLVATRRASPADDLLTDLARGSRDPATGGLTDLELVSTLYLLVMAGFDTTANLLASGTLALLTHPDQLARLRDDPALLPAAVEELLRYTGPVNHANDRFTTEDVRVGDVVVPAGAWVLPMIGAAGRDPERFADPDRLDLDRDARGHLAFGHGVHHCLGADLARVEAEVAFGALVTRFPGLRLAVDPADLRRRPVSLMSGLTALPVQFG